MCPDYQRMRRYPTTWLVGAVPTPDDRDQARRWGYTPGNSVERFCF